MIHTTSVNELVSDARDRLQEMANAPIPPVAKQTKALEKQMADDLQRLLEVAGRAGGDASA